VGPGSHESGDQLESFVVVDAAAGGVTDHAVGAHHGLELVTIAVDDGEIGVATAKALTVRLADLEL